MKIFCVYGTGRDYYDQPEVVAVGLTIEEARSLLEAVEILPGYRPGVSHWVDLEIVERETGKVFT